MDEAVLEVVEVSVPLADELAALDVLADDALDSSSSAAEFAELAADETTLALLLVSA